MTELPRGTVTLLFTDVEGSTSTLQRLGRNRYSEALTDHRRLLREAFVRHGGVEVEMQGDSFHFAFAYARDAVAAAADGQRALERHEWPVAPLSVRIGIHTGEPMETEGLYTGLDVHRAARVMSAGHGGQVLLSERTADIVDGELEDGLTLRLAGRHRLKDLPQPLQIYQLLGDGLRSDYPPLKSLEELDSDPKGSRSRVSRRWVTAAAVGALLAAAAVGALLLRSSPPRPPAVVANSAVAIDPATNRVTDVIPVGTTPTAMAGTADNVWLINADDQTVTKMDAQSRRVVRTIAVGLTPTGLAADAGSVWVSDSNARLVARIDADSSLVLGRIELPPVGLGNPGGGSVEQIAAGQGSLWIANRDRTVSRIDTRTERIVARAIAIGAGSIWVASTIGGSVSRIEPASGRVVATVSLGRPVRGVAVVNDRVWVSVG